MGGGIVGSVLAGSKAKSTSHITIVSPDQQLATDLQSRARERQRQPDDRRCHLARQQRHARHARLHARRQAARRLSLDHSRVQCQRDRPSFSYTPRSAADISTKGTITTALRTVLMRERLTHQGMVASDVDSLMQPVKVDTTQAGKNADTTSTFVAIYVLFFLMYMVILLYGMNVARSIIEEKTSRVFEVLLATIRPEEMMAGKVIGVGSVGLTQVAVWLAHRSHPYQQLDGGVPSAGGNVHVSLNAMQIIFFVVYFLLGYLLYSSIAAALGAMVNSEQELQQLNMFLVMPLAGCMFALAPVISNPSGTVARVLSLIPFCTPLIMYLRISLATPPGGRSLSPSCLMLVTIYAILWVASRIYRVGILMYGKRPNLPEILRWLKYS